MALYNVSFLAQQLYSHRTSLARAVSWCCLATSISSFVKDRFPRADYFEVRGAVLLTTFIVIGLSFPYLWFNVAIGPVCFLVTAIYKTVFPPSPREPDRSQQNGNKDCGLDSSIPADLSQAESNNPSSSFVQLIYPPPPPIPEGAEYITTTELSKKTPLSQILGKLEFTCRRKVRYEICRAAINQDVEMKKEHFITFALFKCQKLQATSCRFYHQLQVKNEVRFRNVFANRVKVLEGGCVWKNDKLFEFPIQSIEAEGQIYLENVSCTGLVKSSDNMISAYRSYLHRVNSLNQVELNHSSCNHLILTISSYEGVIKLNNAFIGVITINNTVTIGCSGHVTIRFEGIGSIPEKIYYKDCQCHLDLSKFTPALFSNKA